VPGVAGVARCRSAAASLFIRLTHSLFDNETIASFWPEFSVGPAAPTIFRALSHKLFIVATDFDSGKSVPFGAPGSDHVPTLEAVRASAALLGLLSASSHRRPAAASWPKLFIPATPPRS
jgi:predicted acylesterase/phospholipase RssA